MYLLGCVYPDVLDNKRSCYCLFVLCLPSQLTHIFLLFQLRMVHFIQYLLSLPKMALLCTEDIYCLVQSFTVKRTCSGVSSSKFFCVLSSQNMYCFTGLNPRFTLLKYCQWVLCCQGFSTIKSKYVTVILIVSLSQRRGDWRQGEKEDGRGKNMKLPCMIHAAVDAFAFSTTMRSNWELGNCLSIEQTTQQWVASTEDSVLHEIQLYILFVKCPLVYSCFMQCSKYKDY